MLITINAMGGLANRMRAIASAMALGSDVGASVDVVWQPDKMLNARFDQLFCTSAMPCRVSEVGSLRYALQYETPRKRNFYLSRPVQKMVYDAVMDDSSERVSNYADVRTRVEGRERVLISSGLEFYPSAPELVSRCFKAVPEIEDMARSVTSRWQGEVVGVHIRRTDNAESILHSPTELFIDYMRGCQTGVKFYVASDDLGVKRQLEGLFPGRIYTFDTDVDRSSTKSIQEALAEMLILAQTSQIVGSHYSSFSEMASRLNGAPLTQLYR